MEQDEIDDLERRIDKLKLRIEDAESAGDKIRMERLMDDKTELEQELQMLIEQKEEAMT